ncbi:MAG TPA: hypothetical protein VK699_02100 [Terriglobales bacterium]|nr:hypothetical protein [Terriglobales bacterium]
MKTVLCTILITFLAGVSYGKDKAPTSVEIKAPAQTVRATIVRGMTGQGWTIDSEGEFQLVFSRNTNSPSTCTDIQPRDFIRFTLAENQDSTLVLASSGSEHAGPFCRDVRENTNQKAMRKILTDLKALAESTTPEPETPSAAAFTPATAAVIQPSASPLSPPPAAIPSAAVAPPVDRSSLNVTLTSAGVEEEESLGVAARRAREKKTVEAGQNSQQ